MTPERAKEILDSGMDWGGYANPPTPEEKAEVIKAWDALPGWTCFNDALIVIALPLLKREGARGYQLHRARVLNQALKGEPVPCEYLEP